MKASVMVILIGCILVADAAAQTLHLSSEILVFSARQGGPNPPGQLDSITNAGAGTLNWKINNPTQLAPWLSVTPTSGGAPANLSVVATSAGLRAGRYLDTVDVASNDAVAPIRTIIVVLEVWSAASFGGAAPPPGGSGGPPPYLATYEIEFEFIGYTGLVEGAPNCQVNPNGYDRLVGTVMGAETPVADEDVVYVGTLRRATAIDFCESRGRRYPGDDERAWCTATLTGSAVTTVELTVYGEDGRGAWLKARPAGGPLSKRLGAGCDPAERTAILAAYPTAEDGGGASPGGQPIDDPQSRLFASNLARLRVGTYPPVGPQGGWTLRVIRRIP
jgi:hypothetical protein